MNRMKKALIAALCAAFAAAVCGACAGESGQPLRDGLREETPAAPDGTDDNAGGGNSDGADKGGNNESDGDKNDVPAIVLPPEKFN